MKKIILFFLLIPILSFSQKKESQMRIDSLLTVFSIMKDDTVKVNLINKLTSKTSFLNFDQVIRKKLIDQNLITAIKINYIQGEGDAYISLGKYYAYEFIKDKALENLNKALVIFTNLKKPEKISKLFNSIGNIYADYNEYPKSLTYYFKAAKINLQIKSYNKLAANYTNIASIYNGLNNTIKSIQYGNSAIKYGKLTNDESLLISNYVLFTQIYTKSNNLKLADRYVNEAYRLSIKNNDFNNIAVCLIGLGNVQKKKGNYLEAIKKTSEALKKFSSIENSLGMASAYSEIGLNYFLLFEKSKKLDYLTKSKYNLNQSNKIYIENELTDGLSENYNQLSKINEIEKNFEESLINFKLYTKFKDSVFNSDNKETIKNLEDKREIELRDKELKINKLSLESKEKQKWFYILGIGFLTILGGLLFYQNRKRKQINSKLETLNQNLDQANKTKTRFFNILNHDLRSPVANLIHFLHLQNDNPELLDEETKNRMQTKTITGAENLLSSMEDILLWSKGQMENFKPQPKNFTINKLFEDTKKVFSGYLKIDFEYHNPENLELFTDENYLKTIVRNLTSNAINILAEFVTSSAVEKRIIWKAYKNENQTYLSITDNGSGSSQEKFKALYDDTEVVGIKSGLGLHLIRDLAKAIDCEISVDSKIGIGTTFILKLK